MSEIQPSDKKLPGRAGYSNELRAKALAMIREGKKPQDTIAAELGIHVRSIIRWRQEAGMPALRLGPKPTKKPLAPPILEAKVAALRAEGLTVKEIGRALAIDWHKVSGVLKQPSTQIEIVRRRELVKSVASEALPSITAKAYGLAEEAIDAKDAKSFDAAARGLHALEKIGSSVSGENQRMQVEHSGSVQTAPPVSAIEQLQSLITIVMGR